MCVNNCYYKWTLALPLPASTSSCSDSNSWVLWVTASLHFILSELSELPLFPHEWKQHQWGSNMFQKSYLHIIQKLFCRICQNCDFIKVLDGLNVNQMFKISKKKRLFVNQSNWICWITFFRGVSAFQQWFKFLVHVTLPAYKPQHLACD